MPRTRIEVAHEIAQTFLPLEQGADALAADAFNAVAVLIRARTKAQLAPATGAAVIAKMQDAAVAAAMTRQHLIDAHAMLAAVRDDVGLGAHAFFGDSEEVCPPSKGQAQSRLSIVA